MALLGSTFDPYSVLRSLSCSEHQHCTAFYFTLKLTDLVFIKGIQLFQQSSWGGGGGKQVGEGLGNKTTQDEHMYTASLYT